MKKLVSSILFLLLMGNSYSQMNSVEFVENKGQWEHNIEYKAKLPAGNIYLEKNEITYQFYDEVDIERMHAMHHQQIKNPTEEDYLLDLHAFKVKFLNANTQGFESKNPSKDYVNYFLGDDESRWAANVKKYARVRYKSLYSNIDLKYYLKDHHLKYDFIVYPNGDASEIKLDFRGHEKLFLEEGTLKITTSVNEMIEDKPYAYQLINGVEKEVECNFVLDGTVLNFEFPKGYDKNQPLIIDPTLIFASYSGSTTDNWGYTSTYDDAGSLYGGGVTFGVGYPITVGAYQVSFAGGNAASTQGGTDITISKFSPDGSTLIYSTYLGGSDNESPHSLIVNSNNELLILGSTSSNNFPVTAGSYDNTYGGGVAYNGFSPNYANGSDITVSKLSASGNNLLASTYIGGTGNDGLNTSATLAYNYADEFRGELIVDGSDNVYVASSTSSNDFPVTPGAFQATLSGLQDGCVFKLSPNLNNLLWSSYIGGTNDDAAYSLQFSSTGEVLLTGGTESPNFPVTVGALNTSYQNFADAWVTKINTTGTSILASTFLGTGSYDQGYFVQLDGSDNVFVVGQTEGTYPMFPTTVYGNPNSGQFLHKLDPNLSSTVFSTTLGTGSGEIDIALSAFLVNDCNYIFISGWGGSLNGPPFSTTTGLPITVGALQSITDGNDYYLMLLSEDADTLLYSTFFGGNSSSDHVDGGTSRFDKKGIVYQAVCASCGSANSDFPTTPGSWSTTDNAGNRCNLGVFKIDLTALEADAELYAGPEYCFGDSVKFQNNSIGGITFLWDFGDGNTSNDFEPVHYYTQPGVYMVSLIILDNVTCLVNDTDYVEVTIKDPNVIVRPDTAVCIGEEITLWAQGGVDHFWNPSTYVTDPTSDTTTAIIMEPTVFHLDVTSNGCILDLEVVVDSLALPTVNLGEDIKTDWGTIVQLFSNSNAVNFWYTPIEGLNCTTCPNPTVTATESSTYYLQVQGANGCFNYDTITIIYDGAIYLPNTFTPDGDGVNDVFFAFGKDIVEFEMYIFNRWGEKLFYSNDINIGWDGIVNGNLSQTGSYVWKVNYKDAVGKQGELYGTVNLLK